MSQFLLVKSSLDFSQNQDVIPQHNVCVCCLVQNVSFIKLATCNHSEILDDIVKIKRDPSSLVCQLCHALIKKIQLFKRQVEESYMALTHQLPNTKSENINGEIKNKLNRSKTEIFHTVKSEPIQIINDDKNANLCPEDSEKYKQSAKFAIKVKIEHDSDFENDIPLSQIKNDKKSQKKKRRKTSSQIKNIKNNTATLQGKYEGRIKTVILSQEEMLAERRKDALRESYLKLPYKCERCITGFDFELTLQDHIDKRHNKKDGSFICEVCKTVLSTESSFKVHTKRHFRRYECEACGKRMSTLHSVVKHYGAQHAPLGGRTYTCQECGYETESNRRYRYHKDKHKGPSQCALCGNTFVNSTGLKTHMFTVHKQSARVYSCAPCGKVYNNKSGLHAHLAAAHAPRAAPPPHCAPCGALFRTEGNLRNHLRTHSSHVRDQDKRFICDECGERFLKKSNLKEHIDWVHLKMSQHECTKCFKVFKNGVALKKHKSFVHDKKRPPRNKICDYCGRGFTTLSILATHVRTHTGERPVRCAHCSATFAHSAARYTHVKLLHRNAPA